MLSLFFLILSLWFGIELGESMRNKYLPNGRRRFHIERGDIASKPCNCNTCEWDNLLSSPNAAIEMAKSVKDFSVDEWIRLSQSDELYLDWVERVQLIQQIQKEKAEQIKIERRLYHERKYNQISDKYNYKYHYNAYSDEYVLKKQYKPL